MPYNSKTRSLWDGKYTGNTADALRRQEIEERIAQRKPLRIVDKAFLRERLGMTTWIRNGKELLA